MSRSGLAAYTFSSIVSLWRKVKFALDFTLKHWHEILQGSIMKKQIRDLDHLFTSSLTCHTSTALTPLLSPDEVVYWKTENLHFGEVVLPKTGNSTLQLSYCMTHTEQQWTDTEGHHTQTDHNMDSQPLCRLFLRIIWIFVFFVQLSQQDRPSKLRTDIVC